MIDRIPDLIILDRETGNLTWAERKASDFSSSGQRSPEGCANNWNSRYAGKPCLTAIGTHGYRWGNFMGKALLAHRAVFFLTHGFMPEYVDHVNGDKLDNRPGNLRQATNGENIANSRSREGSSSKYLGVCWSKAHGKWIANITKNGKCTHIGLFHNEEDAALAYNNAADRLHGIYARPNIV